MAVDVKDINRHDGAGTEYPGITADELNILVERANADEELLKANLGEMIGNKVDTLKGVAGGLATLGSDGKLPQSQLPVGMAWVDQGDGTYKIGILEM